MTRRLSFLALVLLALVLAGCGNANTYFECVARSGSGSQKESHERKRACMERYQTKLPPSVVDSVKGKARFYEHSKRVSGTIHNRSNEWLITEITVAVYPEDKFGEKHRFRSEVEAEPLSSSRFSINTYSGVQLGDDFGWTIEEAYGIPAR